jgi:hypothetical protein
VDETTGDALGDQPDGSELVRVRAYDDGAGARRSRRALQGDGLHLLLRDGFVDLGGPGGCALDPDAHLAEGRRKIDPLLNLYAPYSNYGPQVAAAFAPLSRLTFGRSLAVFLIDRVRQLGAGSERVKILLNRVSDQHLIAPKQIETALGYGIHQTFSSDYRTVSEALNSGVPLSLTNNSDISSQFGSFSRQLVGQLEAAKPQPEKRRAFLGLL